MSSNALIILVVTSFFLSFIMAIEFINNIALSLESEFPYLTTAIQSGLTGSIGLTILNKIQKRDEQHIADTNYAKKRFFISQQ